MNTGNRSHSRGAVRARTYLDICGNCGLERWFCGCSEDHAKETATP